MLVDRKTFLFEGGGKRKGATAAHDLRRESTRANVRKHSSRVSTRDTENSPQTEGNGRE